MRKVAFNLLPPLTFPAGHWAAAIRPEYSVSSLFSEEAVAAPVLLRAGQGSGGKKSMASQSCPTCAPLPATMANSYCCGTSLPGLLPGHPFQELVLACPSSLALARGHSYGYTRCPLSQQAGKHNSIFIRVPSILEKELGHSCRPDP